MKAVDTKGGDLLDWGECRETASFLRTVEVIIHGVQCEKTLGRCEMAGSPNSWPSNFSLHSRPVINYSCQHLICFRRSPVAQLISGNYKRTPKMVYLWIKYWTQIGVSHAMFERGVKEGTLAKSSVMMLWGNVHSSNQTMFKI